jgi:hypothetical protein
VTVQNAPNNKTPTGGIFCDLEKASDCVNHKFLSKLKIYGMTITINYTNHS